MPYAMTSGNPLTAVQRASAHALTLAATPSNGRWDLGIEVRPTAEPGANDIFTIHLTAGSIINVYSETRANSGRTVGLVIYDQDAVPVARERDGYQFYVDQLSDFVAPYTGLYYINALWASNAVVGDVFMRVWVDLPRGPTEESDDVGGRNVLAAGGHDTVWGTIYEDYLRGGEGDDSMFGSGAFDDLHGNQGNDTIDGGLGYDWVVGGQGNDWLTGDGGGNWGLTGDIVLGNLGDDTLWGGMGPDILRGGQGNDSIWGDMDADFLSGDRGDDTIKGGSGADTFQTFVGAGVDRILDFSLAEGDRVMFETPGTPYTLRQEGADTVIDLGGGTQMILVGVNSATLPAGWLVAS